LEVSGRALMQSFVGLVPAPELPAPGFVDDGGGLVADSGGVVPGEDSCRSAFTCAVAGSIATRLNREADPAVLRKARRRFRFGISSAGRIRESCGGFVFMDAA
jgi:hypothetical protein